MVYPFVVLKSDCSDKQGWGSKKIRKFSVKSFISFLSLMEEGSFLGKKVWGHLTPSRVYFFAWKSVCKKVLMLH